MEHTCTPYDHDDCPGCEAMGEAAGEEYAQKTLYFMNGSSDKTYTAIMKPVTPFQGKYRVYARYGRRGGTQTEIEKTKVPVDLWAAEGLFHELIHEKIAKGYSETDPDSKSWVGAKSPGNGLPNLPQYVGKPLQSKGWTDGPDLPQFKQAKQAKATNGKKFILLPLKKVSVPFEAPVPAKWMPAVENDFAELTTGRRIKEDE
jgi:hypothetical protein